MKGRGSKPRSPRSPPLALTVARQHQAASPIFSQAADLRGLQCHVVPSTVLDVTRHHLRHHGALGEEGALCWAGTIADGTAITTTALLFTDAGAWGGIHVPAAHTALLYAHCYARGLTLLAQIHSHPALAFHSGVDEQLPHSAEVGFLSIVVPSFGICAYDAFDEWCVFEQIKYETWREWDSSEKALRLRVADSVIAIP